MNHPDTKNLEEGMALDGSPFSQIPETVCSEAEDSKSIVNHNDSNVKCHSASNEHESSVSSKLSEAHHQELLSSGIPDEFIKRLGHFSANDTTIAGCLGSDRPGITKGLVLAYCDINGKSLTRSSGGAPYYRVKTEESDREEAKSNGEKLPKYLSPTKEGCRPYFAQWVNPKKWTSLLFPLWETEGEKKADALAANGEAAVAFSGVCNWKDSSPRPGEIEKLIEDTKEAVAKASSIEDAKERELILPDLVNSLTALQQAKLVGEFAEPRELPELDSINYISRRVLQAYDSDLIFNPNVQAALVQRAKHLKFSKNRRSDPRCVVLPTEIDRGKNGVDDFIARHGIEALKLLGELAPATIVKMGKEGFGLNPEVLEPNPTYKATMLWAVLKEEWSHLTDVGFYRWAGTHWTQESEALLDVHIQQLMDIHRWQSRTPGLVKAISDEMRKRLTVPEDLWNPPNLVVLKNGTLDAQTRVFSGLHRKTDYCTMALPYEYDSLATCDRWQKFLEQATGDDKEVINLLRAFFRWMLEPKKDEKFSIEKSLELFGDKGTGKSTFLEIAQMLIGESNVGSADIDTFSSAEKLVQLVDKKLACATDINGFMPDVGVFNRVVSNERVVVRTLYSVAKSLRLRVVVMRAYNAHVSVPGGAAGLDRRLCVVKFDIKPKDKDEKLLEKLKQELPGIFWWAFSMPMDEAEQAIQTSGFIKAVQEASIERFEADNIEYSFLSSKYPDGGDGISASTLYSSFKEWCDSNGRRASNNNTFAERITKFGCFKTKTKAGNMWSLPAMSEFDVAAYMGISDRSEPIESTGGGTQASGGGTGGGTKAIHTNGLQAVEALSQKFTDSKNKNELEDLEDKKSPIEKSKEPSASTASTTLQDKGLEPPPSASTIGASASTNGNRGISERDEALTDYLSVTNGHRSNGNGKASAPSPIKEGDRVYLFAKRCEGFVVEVDDTQVKVESASFFGWQPIAQVLLK